MPNGVLIIGAYGSGKSSLCEELAGVLESAGVAYGAIDLDWLGWYGAPVAWDEHEDPRLTLEHLALMAGRYVGLGVERLVLAGSIPSGTRGRYSAAVGVPLAVVGLRVTPELIRRRLEDDPNASRADDLEAALEHLGASGDAAGAPDESDWTIDADAPVGELAAQVLGRLGWLPDDPGAATAGTTLTTASSD